MSTITETVPLLPHLSSPTPAGLSAVARVLATRSALWRPLVEFDADDRFYTRFAGGDGWEAWLLGWLPGQTTGLHDHGDSAGAFIVLEGTLEERTPRSRPRLPEVPDRRGLPAGTRPVGVTTLDSRRLATGQLRTFGPEHLHDVINSDSIPAVSLHVYGPALSRMTRYAIDEDGLLQVLTRETAGADW